MSITCELCGSDKVIPNVRTIDRDQSLSGPLQLAVSGKPQNLIFKDTVLGEIVAHVCGECGHLEMKVTNPAALYQKYLDSQQ